MNKTIGNTLKIGAAAIAAILFVGLDSNAAQAAYGFGGFGLHIGGRNVHLDIGNPHGLYGGYGRYDVQKQSRQSGCRSARVPSRYPQHHSRTHLDWHDTSHFDYIPGRVVRHGNHYNYIPGRKVWHQEGHYDVHHGGHHSGHGKHSRHGRHH